MITVSANHALRKHKSMQLLLNSLVFLLCTPNQNFLQFKTYLTTNFSRNIHDGHPDDAFIFAEMHRTKRWKAPTALRVHTRPQGRP